MTEPKSKSTRRKWQGGSSSPKWRWKVILSSQDRKRKIVGKGYRDASNLVVELWTGRVCWWWKNESPHIKQEQSWALRSDGSLSFLSLYVRDVHIDEDKRATFLSNIQETICFSLSFSLFSSYLTLTTQQERMVPLKHHWDHSFRWCHFGVPYRPYRRGNDEQTSPKTWSTPVR